MKETTKQSGRYWGGSTLVAVVLIILGIFIAITTFLTVIGPVLGIGMAVFGGYLLWKSSKTAAVSDTEPAPEDPANVPEHNARPNPRD